MTDRVMVTGASSGIGNAVVQRLAKEGRHVVALARREDRLRALAENCGPGDVRALTVDVRDAVAVRSAVDELYRVGDTVVCLVNNAGLSLGLAPLHSGVPEDWDTMLATNVGGVLNCTAAVLPRMRAAGGGHIVNIGSVAARYPYHGGNVYAATKAFVHHLSANMRVELQDVGVRVTCIVPGMVRSEFALVRFGGDRARADALYEGIETLTPDDVADAVCWALGTPPHVNVNYVELMPTAQPFGLALGRNNRGKGSS